jgi:hypothetical protein
MTDPINFRIDDLIARYQLHPEWREVFVEGDPDQGLVRTFLEKNGRRNVSIFSISVVNIPSYLVIQRNLAHPSARSELITLAAELERNGVSSSQVACVADADFEYLFPQGALPSLLLLTDYNSMELYAYSAETMHAVLLMAAPKTQCRGANLVDDLTAPLQFLFLARATNMDLKYGLSWIDNIEVFFTIEGGRIRFDEEEFLRKYVVLRVTSERRLNFEVRIQQLRLITPTDPRHRIRGHDFIQLFTWYLRKIEKCKYLNDDSVRQMLYVSLPIEQLAPLQMFSSLLARMSG